jgi:putative RecB family exonuclease
VDNEAQPALPGIEVRRVTVLSPSGLDKYRRCPRLYRFLYVDGLWQYGRTSPQQSFGTSIHSALRDFFRLPVPRRSLQALIRLFKRGWVKEGYETREEQAQEKDRGVEVLRRWYHRTDTTVVPQATEVPLTATFGEVTLKGRLDRIDRTPDGLRVIDYKTGARPMLQRWADTDPALTVYAALVQRRLGEIPAELVLDYIVGGTTVTTRRPPAVLAERLDEILTDAVALRHDTEFRPRTGPWCARCDLLPRCPEGQMQVREDEALGIDHPPRPA